ncbi:MAG: hypothetical protein ACTSRZ_20170 [Promethearchaeota archaeon]
MGYCKICHSLVDETEIMQFDGVCINCFKEKVQKYNINGKNQPKMPLNFQKSKIEI